MDKPLITIITAVYNGVNVLQETIQSVVGCSYNNLQYIIIDGGSSDGTVDIIKKYQHKLLYWCSESDKGVYDAMNKAWDKAPENSYILFLGAGDKLIQLPVLNENSPDIIFGNVIKENTSTFYSTANIRLRLGNTVHHQALLIRKKIHPSPPFNIKYPAYADFDFNQRLLKSGHKFIKDPKFISYAADAGITQEFHKSEALMIVQKNFGKPWVVAARLYYMLQKIYYPLKDIITSKSR